MSTAERLAGCIRQDCEHFMAAECINALPAALAAERKATVERIRAAVDRMSDPDAIGEIDIDILAILDAEAAR